MGRWYYSRKATTEASCDLNIYRLKKWGMLAGLQSTTITWTSSMTGKKTVVFLTVDVTDDPYVRLTYTLGDSKGNTCDYDYQVSLVTTPCNLGGNRYWFACPTCFGRVGVIYLAPSDVHFMCRHCNNLSYHSQNESSPFGILGVTDRKMKKLRSEIKRWTWRGRPTKKVRRLRALERKMGIFSVQTSAWFERFKARLN
jgi:hypothetical protein